jgi:hypothetical protein
VRRGRFLEIVVAGITRALHGRHGARIESLGRLREFDVLI